MIRTSWVGASRRVALLLAVAVASSLLTLLSGATAQAQETAGGVAGSVPGAYPPPPLLNPRIVAAALPAERDALRSLERQAVDLTLAHFGLPATDRAAVQSWARDDALAALWGLMVQAVQTSVDKRTPEQHSVRGWLAEAAWRETLAVGRAVGAEYVKWNGMDQARYQVLASKGTEDQLHEFFKPAESVPGCAYISPEPFYDERSDDVRRFCEVVCLHGCEVFCPYDMCTPIPSIEQFTRFGAARQFSGPWKTGFQRQFSALANAIGTNALQQAANPNGAQAARAVYAAGGAALALSRAATASSIPGGTLVGHRRQVVHFSPWGESAFKDVTKAVASANAALVRAVLGDVDVNTRAWPSWVARIVHATKVDKPAPEAMLQFADSQTALFTIFVAATLPVPDHRLECNNDLVPQSLYGASSLDWLFSWPVLLGEVSTTTEPPWSPCLNQTPSPYTRADAGLQFVVRADGSDYRIQSHTIAVRNVSTASQAGERESSVVRLNGSWFLQHLNTATEGADIQTLGLAYYDWEGRRNYVSLIPGADGSRRFAGVKELTPSTVPEVGTCRTQYLCWVSDRIKYVGADGRKYEAWVRTYQPPSGDPWHSRATAGLPVSFEANGFGPAYTNAGVRHQWRFQKGGCPGPCVSGTGAEATPIFEAPVTGPRQTRTWMRAGTYLAQLTGTDLAGQTVTKTMTVEVAPAKPPVVTLPECAGAEATTGCSRRSWFPGESIELAGSIETIGVDVVDVRVNFGDGTPPIIGSPGSGDVNLPPSSLVLERVDGKTFTLRASHTYAQPGNYLGSVTVRDVTGNVTTAGFTQTVRLPQVVSLPPLPSVEYGERLTLTATAGGSSEPVTYTATPASVCVTTGSHGDQLKTVGAGTCTVTAIQEGDGRYFTSLPAMRSFSVRPAPLVIKADDQAVLPGGAVATSAWTPVGLINGDNASALMFPPTCRPLAGPWLPGVYEGRIRCSGGFARNYSLTYEDGTLTIDPHMSASVSGLPEGLAPQGVLDGRPVALPLTHLRVAYASEHTLAFQPVIADEAGHLLVTVEKAFSGEVTADLDLSATYTTVDALVRAAELSGDIGKVDAQRLVSQWAAVESDYRANRSTEAEGRVQTFLDDVRALRIRDLPSAEVDAIVAHAVVVQEHLR